MSGAREFGVVLSRPCLAGTHGAGRQGDDGMIFIGEPVLREPAADLPGSVSSVRATAIRSGSSHPSAAPMRPSDQSCVAVCFRRSARRSAEPKRNSPAKPVRRRIRRAKGASAAFHLRDITMACPYCSLCSRLASFRWQGEAESSAWQIDHDSAPDAGHIVGERRAQRAADDIDAAGQGFSRAAVSPPNGSGRNRRSRHRERL